MVLLQQMSNRLGISCVPDKITEGGIVLIGHGYDYASANRNYKAIRFSCYGNWPWLRGNENNLWQHDTSELFPNNYRILTSLKMDVKENLGQKKKKKQ
jgi:hypothetical protein